MVEINNQRKASLQAMAEENSGPDAWNQKSWL